MSRVLGVYGGSFNPPHVAHTLVAAYVLAAHRLDGLWVVPAAHHPFEKKLAAFEHRVAMCELAMGDLRRVEVSTIEQKLEGPSLTLRTLETLKAAHPQDHLRLVIGSDLLSETAHWHNFERIAELAPPIVVTRSGHTSAGASGPALPEVSSTEVRRRLRSGASTEGLLSPAVADYIEAQGLYRG